ncbi:MAG: hypothetical protein LBT46_00035 [Planctomycetaceae bacterium]|jgi:hypothetical protein|nr:hypothetical protein [Planctomycetaceae bacterium]
MPAYNISLLGTEGTGKSCFLAGLNYIGSNPLNDAFSVFPKINDPVVKQYLSAATEAFQKGFFPKGTRTTTFLEFDIQIPKPKRNAVMNIKTLDYPGEDFRAGMTQDTPEEKIKEFAEHLLKSDIIILLVDPKDIPDTAESKKAERHNKIIGSINANLQAARDALHKKDVMQKADVCIVITKFDRLPEFVPLQKAKDGGQSIAKEYFLKHWTGFEKTLAAATQVSPKEIVYFPVSAVGNTVPAEDKDRYRDEDNPVQPDRDNIAPFGYDTLFRWIEERQKRLQWRKTCGMISSAIISAVLILLVVISLFGGKKGIDVLLEQEQLAVLDNSLIPVADRLKQTSEPVSQIVEQKRNNLLDKELERIEQGIKQTSDEQQLRNYRDELEKFDFSFTGDRNRTVENRLRDINEKLINAEYQRVKDAFNQRSETFTETANQFLKHYPTETLALEVRRMLDQFAEQNMANHRQRLKGIAVYDAGSLDGKRNEITAFLDRYRSKLSGGEAAAMQRAAELAKQFTEQHQYTVTVKQYGGFDKPEDQILNVLVNDNEFYKHQTAAKSKSVNPDGKFTLTWQCGSVLKIKLQGYGGYFYGGVETVAEISNDKPDALKQFFGNVKLLQKNHRWQGGFFIQCSIAEISEEDWQIFENYILPGSAW